MLTSTRGLHVDPLLVAGHVVDTIVSDTYNHDRTELLEWLTGFPFAGLLARKRGPDHLSPRRFSA